MSTAYNLQKCKIGLSQKNKNHERPYFANSSA